MVAVAVFVLVFSTSLLPDRETSSLYVTPGSTFLLVYQIEAPITRISEAAAAICQNRFLLLFVLYFKLLSSFIEENRGSLSFLFISLSVSSISNAVSFSVITSSFTCIDRMICLACSIVSRFSGNSLRNVFQNIFSSFPC